MIRSFFFNYFHWQDQKYNIKSPQPFCLEKSMKNRSMIIIGAGVAGLSAGCYAQMNGFNSTILEHIQFRGCCRPGKRKGYTLITASMTWLISPESAAHFIWQELGALATNPSISR
jgi:phytoene dehydrogenase-like protein